MAERQDGLFDSPAHVLPGRDAYSAVKGFLTPAMVGVDPAGRTLNAFSDPVEMDKIAKGYACGNCCAEFYSFQLDCPVCHQPTHVQRQRQDTPELWQSHVDQRGAPIGTAGPDGRPLGELELERPQVRSIDEFIAAVGQNPDTEQVALSRLKPAKFGRGRPK